MPKWVRFVKLVTCAGLLIVGLLTILNGGVAGIVCGVLLIMLAGAYFLEGVLGLTLIE